MLPFRFLFLFSCVLFCNTISAQELFPNTESASTLPKGVPGIRIIGETYNENGLERNAVSLRAMYGITSHWSVWVQGGISNHHDSILPPNLVTHIHQGAQTIYYTGTKQYGKPYKYRLSGIHLYTKYRIYSHDGPQTHLRVALFGEYSTVYGPHDEAEPNLDDNGGYAGGMIITRLQRRLALSISSGFIQPKAYTETINHGGSFAYIPQTTRIQYGQAITYSLSAGYRIYPQQYTSYAQDNYNLYIELIGKSYTAAKVVQNGMPIEVRANSLKASHYLDGTIGVQRVINSNTRIDLTAAFPLINRSYAHFYPMFTLGLQTYFYRKDSFKK